MDCHKLKHAPIDNYSSDCSCGNESVNPYEIKWPMHYNDISMRGVERRCEPWVDQDGQPITTQDGEQLYRIAEFVKDIPMGSQYECANGTGGGQPVWPETSCGLVGRSFELVDVGGIEICTKMVRRWTIVDWCTWDASSGLSGHLEGGDSFEFVDDRWLDLDEPENSGRWSTDSRKRGFASYSNYPESGYITNLSCQSFLNQAGRANHKYFRYTHVVEDGYYVFDQQIEVAAPAPPLIETAAAIEVVTSIDLGVTDGPGSCKRTKMIHAKAIPGCDQSIFHKTSVAWWIRTYRSDKNGIKGALLSTKTAHGLRASINSAGEGGDYYLLEWNVQDACGNRRQSETLVSFVDDTVPDLICNDLPQHVTMTATGTVDLWASDYNNAAWDNCSNVSYSFLLDQGGYPTRDVDKGHFADYLFVDCNMLTKLDQGEELLLEQYVHDASGNFVSCPLTIQINWAAETCDLASSTSLVMADTSTSKRSRLKSQRMSDTVETSKKKPSGQNYYSTAYEAATDATQLYQNVPNPFTEKTAISFDLSTAGVAEVEIFDGLGRVVWSKTAHYSSGAHRVWLFRSELKISGALYYSLSFDPDDYAVGSFFTIRSMMLLE